MPDERRLRILLVDDEPDILLLLQAMLSADAWEIVGKAGSGEDAARIAEKIEPDVAVVDYMMPGMSGLDLAGRLKELHPNCYILLFSAYSMAEESEAHPAVDGFLSKTDVGTIGDVLSRIARDRDLGS